MIYINKNLFQGLLAYLETKSYGDVKGLLPLLHKATILNSKSKLFAGQEKVNEGYSIKPDQLQTIVDFMQEQKFKEVFQLMMGILNAPALTKKSIENNK